MFEEIVRQYALEQVKSSFMLSNIGIFAFSNTRKENLPEYNKKLLKHLEDKEYSKIDCDFNSFCFIHTTKAALLYLKGQYSDVLSFCKKEEKDQELSEFFISIVEYEKENSAFALAKLIELSSYKSKLPTILKNPLAGIINEIYS